MSISIRSMFENVDFLGSYAGYETSSVPFSVLLKRNLLAPGGHLSVMLDLPLSRPISLKRLAS